MNSKCANNNKWSQHWEYEQVYSFFLSFETSPIFCIFIVRQFARTCALRIYSFIHSFISSYSVCREWVIQILVEQWMTSWLYYYWLRVCWPFRSFSLKPITIVKTTLFSVNIPLWCARYALSSSLMCTVSLNNIYFMSKKKPKTTAARLLFRWTFIRLKN